MPDDSFYSDRAGLSIPRTGEEISANVWRGFVSLLRRRIDDGSLAYAFPLRECPDGHAITGTDETLLLDALDALIPGLSGSPLDAGRPQGTVNTLDIIDFIGRHINQPTYRDTHHWNGEHSHFIFNDQLASGSSGNMSAPGQAEFRNDVELLFARNGIAFTIGDDMRVRRLGPPEARHLISDFDPKTGDSALDSKLIDAMTRFVSRNLADRRDAVEKLWDAFERLKTLEMIGHGSKKGSATKLIANATTGFESFGEVLEAEFKMLTSFGNSFGIRHHEHNQVELPGGDELDYLFVRLAALIAYVLRRTGRMTE